MSQDLSQLAWRDVQDGNVFLESQGAVLRGLRMDDMDGLPAIVDGVLRTSAFINGMECEINWFLGDLTEKQLNRMIIELAGLLASERAQ